MAVNPKEEERVRGVLATYGLPGALGTYDFGSVPPGAAGAYVAQTDTFLLNIGADDQTIIHEGAHAEHYAIAGIVGAQFPSHPDTAIGALILSEAYVGYRLASVNGFQAHEYARLGKYRKTVVEIAAAFVSPTDAQGPPLVGGGSFVPGKVMTTTLFKFLLLVLPIVVAEGGSGHLSASLYSTASHPSVSGTGTIFLNTAQAVVALVVQSGSSSGIRSALTAVANMASIGTSFMNALRASKVV